MQVVLGLYVTQPHKTDIGSGIYTSIPTEKVETIHKGRASEVLILSCTHFAVVHFVGKYKK